MVHDLAPARSALQLRVFVARLRKRPRDRLDKPLLFVTHAVESIREFAMLLGDEPLRIVGGLVNVPPIDVLAPRLDVASRNDDEHRFVSRTPVDATSIALLIERSLAQSGRVLVSIGDDQEVRVSAASNCFEFVRVSRPHPLLARLASIRQRECADFTRLESSLAEKPSNECLVSLIFAKQDDLDSHSHPRATVSEIERPSTVFAGRSLTRAGPVSSLENHSPLAPAM